MAGINPLPMRLFAEAGCDKCSGLGIREVYDEPNSCDATVICACVWGATAAASEESYLKEMARLAYAKGVCSDDWW